MKTTITAIAAFLLGLSLAITVNSFAQVWATATVTSYHFDRSADFNEKNPGLGLEVQHGPGRIVGGIYRNSIDRTSVYAGYAWAPQIAAGVRAGAVGGVVTGYRISPVPLIAPVLMLEGRKAGVNFIFVPDVLKEAPGMVGVQLKWRLE